MFTAADALPLNSAQKQALESLVRAGSTPQLVARKCKAILLASEGTPNNSDRLRVRVRPHDLELTRYGGSDAGVHGTVRRVLTAGALVDLLQREEYDAVFTLLPSAYTHAHHRAAALLVLEAVEHVPEARRPAVLGAEPGNKGSAGEIFPGVPGHPLARPVDPRPYAVFDRTAAFGYHNALNYQIVVNWVIAEHKSQGLFQTDAGRHDLERFWLFEASGAQGAARAARLGLAGSVAATVAVHPLPQ